MLRPDTGAWQTVARSQDLPEGAVTGFDTGTVTGFVGWTAGGVFAISGVCTHLGCRLALDGPARELRCPCHSATFTLTGTVRSHPRLGACRRCRGSRSASPAAPCRSSRPWRPANAPAR